MNTMKSEIELRLIGSLLSDWCKQKAENQEGFLYQSGFDSTHRVIRFATTTLQALFQLPKNQSGHWKMGLAAVYEIHNEAEGVTLTCTVSSEGLSKRECVRLQQLVSACKAEKRNETYQLADWCISDEAENANKLTQVLDQILAFEVAWFESELLVWKTNPEHKIRTFPKDSLVLVKNSDLPEELYMEGAQRTILTNRYERNPKARARCIAVHGSACKVCGFDFGLVFGEEFSGKIEVHHIKPISEIGEEYVVDPVKDLVPVCPNCHMMLHSKHSGVYSVEELKQMRQVR